MVAGAVVCAFSLDEAPRASAASSQAVSPSTELKLPDGQTEPPPRHRYSAREMLALARRNERVRRVLAAEPGASAAAYTKGPGRWQVSYHDGGDEVAQVLIDERGPTVIEAWTGAQVAWPMARGIEGAFGRKVSAPYVWIPLMAAFFLVLFDWRRPARWLHLDLLVLLSFSASQYFFNRGDIDTSVPLVYPVLGYLLLRLLWVAYLGKRRSRAPWKPALRVPHIVLLLIFLIGFRIGLNITDSNVIDVGYSGVIGADRIAHAQSPYGEYPRDNGSGDTYGPVIYYAYVPFEAALPWSGSWDELPAAHGAAIAFDLLAMLGLFLAGRRLRAGPDGVALGVVLAFAWASYPYSLYVMNSNANDSLIAALVTFAFVAATSPRGRGAILALAGAAKFAPLALAPLFATYDRRSWRDALAFAGALVATSIVVYAVALPDGGPRELWDRTVGFQLGRDSPFSIWARYDLGWLQDASKALAIALALAVAVVPARKSRIQLAALGAAVLIALQLTLSHWFYLYIVWWLPLALVALLAAAAGTDRSASPPASSPAL
jgi:hypothetical protein